MKNFLRDVLVSIATDVVIVGITSLITSLLAIASSYGLIISKIIGDSVPVYIWISSVMILVIGVGNLGLGIV